MKERINETHIFKSPHNGTWWFYFVSAKSWGHNKGISSNLTISFAGDFSYRLNAEIMAYPLL